ncbi:MAG: hypothetical protein JOY92_12905 [Verrucomicrobia bacterium]|nr:hypothetical protein [Verrucomicrobiota bacterium]
MKPVSVRNYLQALYLLKLVQTGSHSDARRRTRLGVERWASAPDQVCPRAWDELSQLLQEAIQLPVINPAPSGELSGWLLRLHELPEPERSILTLFYAALLPLSTLSSLFQLDLPDFAGHVAQGRRDLGFDPGPSNGLPAGAAPTWLDALDCPFYDPATLNGMRVDGRDQKPGSIALLEHQRRFDQLIGRALREHRPDQVYLASLSSLVELRAGAALRGEAAAIPRSKNAPAAASSKALNGGGAPAQRAEGKRPKAAPAGVVEDDPAEDEPEEEKPRHARLLAILIAIGIGIVGTIAIGWFIISEQMNSFTGSERVSELLDSANAMNGDEFEPVNATAKDLEDYFFLKHGLEHYSVPKELGNLKAIGCRVAKVDGADVAEIMAVDAKETLLFLFQPAQLGVKIKPGRWEIIQGEDWVGGLNGDKEMCCMVAFRGTRDDMKAFLRAEAK